MKPGVDWQRTGCFPSSAPARTARRPLPTRSPAANHLHQLHHWCRVKEMQACHSLGMTDIRRNRRDRDRRCVAGKQGLRRADLRQFGKQRFSPQGARRRLLSPSAAVSALISVTGVSRARICPQVSSVSLPRVTREALANAVNGAENGV